MIYQNFIKKIDDTTFEKYKGTTFNESWYETIINKDSDGYYIDLQGNRQVLFKFRKGLVSNELMELASNIFLQESKKKHPNRGIAAGIKEGQKNARIYTKTGQNEGQYVSSNIFGYYDRPLREHRKYFKTIKVCRKTAFNIKHPLEWDKSLPFISRCSSIYKKLGGRYYNLQKKEWDSINNNLKIPNSVFTTITANYNWRTSCHKDKGDYSLGLGNLVVVGNNFTGGYLGFPQFKVLIAIKPGDFLLMDVHQWHCNTAISIGTNGYRLSFVMYIRNDMNMCKNVKIVDSVKYYH